MLNRQFYRFSESNDNEGETWHFYLPLTPEEHTILATAVADEDSDNPYELSDKPISEERVDILVEELQDEGGYMPSHNKCEPLSDKVLKALKKYNPDNDILYKGQAWKVTKV